MAVIDLTGYLEQISRGDENAFRFLFETHRARVYTYLLKITGSTEMAEDGVQEIFLKLWTNRQKLSAVENFNAYLYRVAQNHAYSGFRKTVKKERAMKTLQNFDMETQHPADILQFKEVEGYIHTLLKELTPQQRSVFRLSREAGLKHEEIAEKLGINILTVKKHMSQALSTLRQKIIGRYGIIAIIFLCS